MDFGLFNSFPINLIFDKMIHPKDFGSLMRQYVNQFEWTGTYTAVKEGWWTCIAAKN